MKVAIRAESRTPAIPITPTMQFRFQAQDLPGLGSVVEAALDEIEVIEPTGGCSICPAQGPVGKILGSRSGNDVVFDWTADPVSATRYVVYQVSGSAFNVPLRIGTVSTKTFTHVQAAALPGNIYYFVSAVNACGAESAFDTE